MIAVPVGGSAGMAGGGVPHATTIRPRRPRLHPSLHEVAVRLRTTLWGAPVRRVTE